MVKSKLSNSKHTSYVSNNERSSKSLSFNRSFQVLLHGLLTVDGLHQRNAILTLTLLTECVQMHNLPIRQQSRRPI